MNDSMVERLTNTLLYGSPLPSETFTREEFFSMERHRLFHRHWMAAAFSSDAADSGDLHPFELGGIPLVLVRDSEGQCRVFHNVCSHRGAKLVNEKTCGNRRMVCPYHCWTYDLSGRIVRTPHIGGSGRHRSDEIDTTSLGLRPVAAAEWAGLVFVRIADDGSTFEEAIAPVARRWDHVRVDRLRPDPETESVAEFAANWKLVIENFVESYHVPSIHPALQQVNPMSGHYQILGGDTFLGQGGTIDDSNDAVLARRARISHFSSQPGGYEALYVFPNLLLIACSGAAAAILIEPLASDRTRERLVGLFDHPAAFTSDISQHRREFMAFLRQINTEDIDIVERLHKGRGSPAFTGGVFAPAQEATSRQFHQLVAKRMLAAAGRKLDIANLLAEGEIHHPARATADPGRFERRMPS